MTPSSTSHTTRRKIELEEPIPIPIIEPKILEATRTVEQLDPKKLYVTVDYFPVQDHFQNLEHYVQIASNGTEVIWSPASGYKIHLVSLLISVTASGEVILYKRTPGAPPVDTIIHTFIFGAKGSSPFTLGTDLDFNYDQQLVAHYQNGGAEFAYVTAIGHEHNPSDFPP